MGFNRGIHEAAYTLACVPIVPLSPLFTITGNVTSAFGHEATDHLEKDMVKRMTHSRVRCFEDSKSNMKSCGSNVGELCPDIPPRSYRRREGIAIFG